MDCTLVLTLLLALFSASYQLTQQERNLCLNVHNKLRSLHQNTSPLVYDVSLEMQSQKWADHLAQIGRLSHDMNSGVGENLYWSQSWRSSTKGDSSAKATLAWYEEIKDYSFSSHQSINGRAVGHFTQLIWKETKSLGCGIKEIRKNGRIETYIVSRYSPRGNSIRRNWGESSSQARIRVYGTNVQKRNIGAQTPTLPELEKLTGGSGTGPIPTGGPLPQTTQRPATPPSSCSNARGDDYCNYVLRCGRNYLCNGRHKNYFMQDCYKACTFC